jgi:hypothetical protein
MLGTSEPRKEPAAGTTVVTLGPSGTCHERDRRSYVAFQGIGAFEVEFIEDFFDGLELIRGREDAFLVQCCAHRSSTR